MKATGIERTRLFLEEELLDPESGFSIGVPGAIAEFMRSDGEAEIRRQGTTHTVTTRDGAMRVALTPEIIPVAAESPSRKPMYWQQQVAFCLNATHASMGGRRTLTELDADADAIDASGRKQLRFDLGLGIPHIDACIRTDDTHLIALLRRFEGRPLLGEAHEARDAIVAESPERVFCSRLGRIEVLAPIPERKTPQGPHTHLLPKLLGRPSTIAEFFPRGVVSCLDVYPANPLRRMSGETRPFDPERHARFQRLLEAWAPSSYLEQKRCVADWVREGRKPEACPPAKGPLAELGRRVALSQLALEGADQKSLAAWHKALTPD